jgi:hypothetical protein
LPAVALAKAGADIAASSTLRARRTMAHQVVQYDEVMKVLRECELKLRTLQEQGRLTVEGLREFVALSTKVQAELDRRQLPDRRAIFRHSPDRRAAALVRQEESVEPA